MTTSQAGDPNSLAEPGPDDDATRDDIPVSAPLRPRAERSRVSDRDPSGLMYTILDGPEPADGLRSPPREGLTRTSDGSPTATRNAEEEDEDSLAFQLNHVPMESPRPGDSTVGLNNSDRFTIDHRLGTGGMGVVYQAYDRLRGEHVALKTMRRIEPATLYRFKQEFRTLAGVAHPNLVNLYELIALNEVWFFTMELVRGVDFIDHVRALDPDGPTPDAGPRTRLPPGEPLGPARLTRLRPALRQLAEGVAALHDAEKVHRDIKPNNVLVTAEGRVVLLDFGLTADLGQSGLHHAVGERVAGTMGYMSPEQAAGQPLSAASDWYSVGVILYEALTGVLPIDGSGSESEVFDETPPPQDVAAGVPDDLNTLCLDLLRRDPEERPTGPEVLARLSAEPALAPARRGAQGRGTLVSLIGRERHREALDAAYGQVRAGNAVILFVSGRAGSGKSTLLQAFLAGLIEDDEAVVLSGRCYERESVPYKALDSVVDALSRYLMLLPRDEVNALLPPDVASLARMFPVLQRVEAIAAAPRARTEAADQQEVRRQAVTALRALLAAIGRVNPLVVAIDDLQWGDLENATLLEDLVRPPDAPLMLLIGAYRTTDPEETPLIRALLGPRAGGPDRRELDVGALTYVESRELTLALLGRNDPEARAKAHLVAKQSQGNPFFIDELVKHIQSGEGLSEGGAINGQVALDEVLWRRVSRLPDGARRLLEMVAVSGRPISLLDACQAASLGADGRASAAALRAGRLVRGTARTHRDEVEAYHDWVCQTVVSRLPAEVVMAHHLRLAQVLEAGGQADPETLAVHYERGGLPHRAAENYARAADRAAATLAFGHAAKLYRLALQLQNDRGGGGGDAEAIRLRSALGDALANAGRGREAADEFLAASQWAAAADALELKRRAAMQLLISGHVEDGFALLRTVLDARGMSVPSGPTGAILALVRRRAWLRVRGLGFTPRDATQVSAETLSLIDLCWSAAAGLSIIDPLRAGDFQARGLLLALGAGEPYRVARALALEAATAALGGLRSSARAEALLTRAEAVARPLGNPHLSGLIALAHGLSALMLGRWKDAKRWLAGAEPILRDHCTGVVWELDTVRNLLHWAIANTGDLTELRSRWQDFVRGARQRGDLYALTTLSTYYRALLKLADDEPALAQVETDEVMARWSHRGYHIQHSAALRARTSVALYRGDSALAWVHVRSEWQSYRRSPMPRIQMIRVQMLELRARCALAAIDPTAAPSRSLLREAFRGARSLDREGLPWASAHATLLRAGIAARQGDDRSAVALLLDATARYAAADMRLHAAAARRCAGRLAGGETGRALLDAADTVFASQGVRNPAAFAALFVPWVQGE